MKQVTMDSECTEFLDHLTSLAAGRGAPDPILTDSFTQGLFYHNPDLFATLGDSCDSCNPAIKNILSLLFRVCPSSPKEYTDLLEKILKHLPLPLILLHVSEDVIFENIGQTFMEVMIFKAKNEDPQEVVAFVQGKNLMGRLVDSLFEPNTSTEVKYKITTFLRVYYEWCWVQESPIFWQEWVAQPSFSPTKLVSCATIWTYLDVLRIMTTCKVDSDSMERALEFELADIFPDSETPELFMPTIGFFLIHFLQVYDLGENSRRFLDSVLTKYAVLLETRKDSVLLVDNYHQLLGTMLRGSDSRKNYILEFLRLHPPQTEFLDFSGPFSATLFCLLELAVFEDPDGVFRAHFADWSIESVPEPKFHAMLHLITDERFFTLLTESGNFSWPKINLLPRNLWLNTVWKLLQYNYSMPYVLESPGFFPKLLGGEKLASEESMALKRAIFRCLDQACIDLGEYSEVVSQMAK